MVGEAVAEVAEFKCLAAKAKLIWVVHLEATVVTVPDQTLVEWLICVPAVQNLEMEDYLQLSLEVEITVAQFLLLVELDQLVTVVILVFKQGLVLKADICRLEVALDLQIMEVIFISMADKLNLQKINMVVMFRSVEEMFRAVDLVVVDQYKLVAAMDIH